MSQPFRTELAGLRAWEVPGQPGAPVVVLLHGFGADASDLLPLHRELAVPGGARWVVPDAPLTLGLSPLAGGRAWFPIDQQAVEQAVASGSHRDLSQVTPAGLSEAREAVLQLVAALQVPLQQVVLAGFSQGAMVATEVALTLPVNIAGLLLFSGTLLHEQIWRELACQHQGLRFFQSHGRWDPLLGVTQARRLHATLLAAGLQGALHEFDGHHEIPRTALRGAQTLLDEVFSSES